MGYLQPGAHWEYIAAAYGATVAILAALIAFTLLASRRARRDLEALEQRGARRRSAAR